MKRHVELLCMEGSSSNRDAICISKESERCTRKKHEFQIKMALTETHWSACKSFFGMIRSLPMFNVTENSQFAADDRKEHNKFLANESNLFIRLLMSNKFNKFSFYCTHSAKTSFKYIAILISSSSFISLRIQRRHKDSRASERRKSCIIERFLIIILLHCMRGCSLCCCNN